MAYLDNTLQYILQHPDDHIAVLVHMIRNKPLGVVHGLLNAMKIAGIHISVIMQIAHRSHVTGSLILASMALGIALIDLDLTADRAETAICVAFE